jgi:hypothetical protein
MRAGKDVLTSWISKALRQALIVKNILFGFRATGIYPLNNIAMDSKMSSSSTYFKVLEEDQPSVSADLQTR